MLYAAKCYWPSVTAAALEQVAGRAARAGLDTGAGPVPYPGCLLFAADDLVLPWAGHEPAQGPAALTFHPRPLLAL